MGVELKRLKKERKEGKKRSGVKLLFFSAIFVLGKGKKK